MSRRIARRKAFFVVYQFEFHQDFDLDELLETTLFFNETFEDEVIIKDSVREFVYNISSGTNQNIEIIDDLIKKYSIKWDFNRLNKIDVAILRVALYEMLFREDIPIKVSANEAVELAKVFGTDDSSSFINGILGSIIDNGEINDK